jgi:PIN domain nuclease of toxin-antitoxin system
MLILDTHAFIWWMTDDVHLPARGRAMIGDPAEDVAVPSASFYEWSYKHMIGKIPIDVPPDLPELLRKSRFRILDMTAAVAVRAGRLPNTHRDPWDRIIAAHGIETASPILTADPALAALGAKTVW